MPKPLCGQAAAEIKYITRDLYNAMQCEPDTPESDAADACWESQCSACRTDLESIRSQLPASMQAFCETSLHDGVVCPSLSHFLVTFCLQEIIFGSRHLFFVEDDAVQSRDKLVKDALQPVWLEGIYVWRKEQTLSSFICDNRLMVLDTHGCNYFIAFNQEDAIDLVSRPKDMCRIN